MQYGSYKEVYRWDQDIAPSLDSIQKVEGGFTSARRGIVVLNDRTKVFVKIATDESTKKWLKKEIKVYKTLNEAGYAYIPTLLSTNADSTAMAIEYLQNASFENTWDKAKLEAVVKAQESLKEYKKWFVNNDDFKSDDVVDLRLRWPHLLKSDNVEKVNEKLKRLGSEVQFSRQQIEDFKQSHEGWELKQDTLIHQDIRADNFGYDTAAQAGKLIDWNWLCIGDESLDTTPLFINMYLAGFNPYQHHPEKYDEKMLMYLIGYWLASILDGDQDSGEQEWKLRSAQAKNLEACVALLDNKTAPVL